MANETKIIEEKIYKYGINEIIVSSELFKEFNDISEELFYKVLERMTKSGKLQHITKGIYVIPKKTEYGIVPITEKEIFDYYLRNNRGVLIGYGLYNRLGLTTQTTNDFKIYTNRSNSYKKKIKNVEITNIEFELTNQICKYLEVMDVIQNFEFIEDLNENIFYSYVSDLASNYNDKEMSNIISKMKYKKSTIASLKGILDYFEIENSLNEYLSSLSKYKTIDIRRIYETSFNQK